MPEPSTMAARGQDYVAAWPAGITRKLRLTPAYVAEALVRAGHATEDERPALATAILRGEPVDQDAALTPDTTKAVIAELRANSADLTETTKTHCHYCGLKHQADGECRSCGEGL
ncbi:hypothetical protein AB0465_40680 [Streptomyces griseoviridis]|uniref:hypothetical protein n=1 Tax=Streptomyces griseoviridis TaxID=45398 RepID=UPI0034501326